MQKARDAKDKITLDLGSEVEPTRDAQQQQQKPSIISLKLIRSVIPLLVYVSKGITP